MEQPNAIATTSSGETETNWVEMILVGRNDRDVSPAYFGGVGGRGDVPMFLMTSAGLGEIVFDGKQVICHCAWISEDIGDAREFRIEKVNPRTRTWQHFLLTGRRF